MQCKCCLIAKKKLTSLLRLGLSCSHILGVQMLQQSAIKWQPATSIPFTSCLQICCISRPTNDLHSHVTPQCHAWPASLCGLSGCHLVVNVFALCASAAIVGSISGYLNGRTRQPRRVPCDPRGAIVSMTKQWPGYASTSRATSFKMAGKHVDRLMELLCLSSIDALALQQWHGR